MSNGWERLLQVDVAPEGQRARLAEVAARRNWGLALVLVGWLHLLAFGFCYYLTVGCDYHEPGGYLAVWVGELCGVWVIFRACGGRRTAAERPLPLEQVVRRIWIAYFILAFDLGSLNTLRGHTMFEFFPAIGTLASFAFFMMTVVVSWRFLAAGLVMFASGLLMAAHLLHAYLIFALAWWLVLNAIGLRLGLRRRVVPRASRAGGTVPRSLTAQGRPAEEWTSGA